MNGELIRNQRYSELTDHTCDSSNGKTILIYLNLVASPGFADAMHAHGLVVALLSQ